MFFPDLLQILEEVSLTGLHLEGVISVFMRMLVQEDDGIHTLFYRLMMIVFPDTQNSYWFLLIARNNSCIYGVQRIFCSKNC